MRKNPTETNIEAEASAMVSGGLAAHGFEFVNVDDYYYLDPATTVDANGRWVVDAGEVSRRHGGGGQLRTRPRPQVRPLHDPGHPRSPPTTRTRPSLARATTRRTSSPLPLTLSRRTTVTRPAAFGSDLQEGDVQDRLHQARRAGLHQLLGQTCSPPTGSTYLKLDGVGTSTVADITAWSAALQQSGRAIHFELSNNLVRQQRGHLGSVHNGWRIDGDIEAYGTYQLSAHGLVERRQPLQRRAELHQLWAVTGALERPRFAGSGQRHERPA